MDRSLIVDHVGPPESGMCAAQMVYGTELRLPGDDVNEEGETITDPKEFVEKPQQVLRQCAGAAQARRTSSCPGKPG